MPITLDGTSGITTPGVNFGVDTITHYEEGTWTPTLYGATTAGTMSYTERSGVYVRIGKLVHVEFLLIGTITSAPSGNVIVSGLPFVSETAPNGRTLPSTKGAINRAPHDTYIYVSNNTSNILFARTGGMAENGVTLTFGANSTDHSTTSFQMHAALSYRTP